LKEREGDGALCVGEVFCDSVLGCENEWFVVRRMCVGAWKLSRGPLRGGRRSTQNAWDHIFHSFVIKLNVHGDASLDDSVL